MPRVSGGGSGSPKGLSLREQIHQQIKQEIITGRLAPGQPLRVGELSERYGASTTPVREALTCLLRDKLVTYMPNRGFMVSSVSIKDVHEIYEVWGYLGRALMRLAVRNITEAEIQILQRARDVTYDPLDPHSVDDYFQANHVFYLTLAAASRNSRLISHWRSLLEEEERLVYLYLRDSHVIPDWRPIYQRLIDALKNRDEASTAAAFQEIVENTKESLLGASK